MVGEARRHNWPFPLRARFETLRQLSKNEIRDLQNFFLKDLCKEMAMQHASNWIATLS